MANRPARTACAVRGCGGTPDSRNQQVSRYCKMHTCIHFWIPLFPGAQPCQLQKTPTDSVCQHHVECQAYSCTNGRIECRNPASRPGEPQYRRLLYCFEHKCEERSCETLRKLDVGGRYYRYCENHNCAAVTATCYEKAMGGGFCARHKCAMCNREIETHSARFCRTHNTCEWIRNERCTRRKEAGFALCVRHRQCDIDVCSELKEAGSMFCRGHTCPIRGCTAAIDNLVFKICITHRCRYAGCGEHQMIGLSPHCSRHSCHHVNCTNSIDLWAIFCRTHACTHLGCRDEAEFEGRCRRHLRDFYQREAEDISRTRLEEMEQRLKTRIEELEQSLASTIRQSDQKIDELQRELDRERSYRCELERELERERRCR
ncbi:hypothetical protein GGR54DRAFT_25441 [Hypoxylon sp. NC1633]|nr:hypothetical protein GGR54DRAFT_25441 [Hypoxylon sp. NC1633]